MLMRGSLILFSLLLISCARENWEPTIDPDFQENVDEFSGLYGKEMPGLKIVYGDYQDNKIAVCSIRGEHRTITVDRDQWPILVESQKRATMFHELGHCVMGRKHTDNQMSFMYKDTRPGVFYDAFDALLIADMFN